LQGFAPRTDRPWAPDERPTERASTHERLRAHEHARAMQPSRVYEAVDGAAPKVQRAAADDLGRFEHCSAVFSLNTPVASTCSTFSSEDDEFSADEWSDHDADVELRVKNTFLELFPTKSQKLGGSAAQRAKSAPVAIHPVAPRTNELEPIEAEGLGKISPRPPPIHTSGLEEPSANVLYRLLSESPAFAPRTPPSPPSYPAPSFLHACFRASQPIEVPATTRPHQMPHVPTWAGTPPTGRSSCIGHVAVGQMADVFVTPTFLPSSQSPVWQEDVGPKSTARYGTASVDTPGQPSQCTRSAGLPVLRLEDILSGRPPPSMLQMIPTLGSSPTRPIMSQMLPTLGSWAHQAGTCKPCAFAWKNKGCSNGTECPFCHLCGPKEGRTRKKDRKVEMQAPSFGMGMQKQLPQPQGFAQAFHARGPIVAR